MRPLASLPNRDTLNRRFCAMRQREGVSNHDGFQPYRNAIPNTLEDRASFATLTRVYRATPQGEHRYSPAEVVATEVVPVVGRPDPMKICTTSPTTTLPHPSHSAGHSRDAGRNHGSRLGSFGSVDILDPDVSNPGSASIRGLGEIHAGLVVHIANPVARRAHGCRNVW